MRAAIYARVSSATQRDRHTIASQLRVLPEFAAARGWQVVGIYVDDGRTAKAGKLEKRTGLADLLRDAGERKFDVVVVLDVDRLTRSEDLAERGAIIGTFQRAGILVACAGSGGIHDLNSSEGDLNVALQGYFAADWTRKHRKRIVEGKLTAIANGKKPAGPTPYGFRYDRAAGVWSVCEEEAAIVREVYTRTLAGETGNAIGEDLRIRAIPRPKGGEWSAARVYAMLRQAAYRGEWTADRHRKLTIAVPAIIEPATWYAVRDRAGAVSRRGAQRAKHSHLLEGLATCDLCGAPIRIASASFRGRSCRIAARYVCLRRRRPDRGTEPCRLPYLTVAEVDARLWSVIEQLIQAPGRLERAVQRARDSAGADRDAWKEDLVRAEKRLAQLERAQDAIMKRFRNGLITEEAFDRELVAGGRERQMAQEQVEAARRAQFAAGRRESRADALERLVADLRRRASETSPARRRELVVQLLAPGSVRLSIATIAFDVAIEPSTSQLGGPHAADGSSSVSPTSIRFRMVA